MTGPTTTRTSKAPTAWWWILALVLVLLVAWAIWGFAHGPPTASSSQPAPELSGAVALQGGGTAPLA
jgi:hypothetical protein